MDMTENPGPWSRTLPRPRLEKFGFSSNWKIFSQKCLTVFQITFHVGFLRASVVSIQRTLGKRQYNWQQLKHIKTKRTTKLPTGKLKSNYAAIDEDDERKDMESPHDEVTSARSREINNHDTYFAKAFIYNFAKLSFKCRLALYSLVCSFVCRHHDDISIYLHRMMY